MALLIAEGNHPSVYLPVGEGCPESNDPPQIFFSRADVIVL